MCRYKYTRIIFLRSFRSLSLLRASQVRPSTGQKSAPVTSTGVCRISLPKITRVCNLDPNKCRLDVDLMDLSHHLRLRVMWTRTNTYPVLSVSVCRCPLLSKSMPPTPHPHRQEEMKIKHTNTYKYSYTRARRQIHNTSRGRAGRARMEGGLEGRSKGG